jgi:hypothetical protein
MGKQSRRIRVKDSSMTKELMEEGKKMGQSLMAIKNIHHSLDIDNKYKKVPCWIAMELADEEEDFVTFQKILDLHPLMIEHIKGTMGCFAWKFIGNTPIMESPWKKGECYEETKIIYDDKKKTTEFLHSKLI